MPSLLDTRDRSPGSAAPLQDWPRLLVTFDVKGARYRVIPHAAEWRVDEVSRLRGNPVEQSARCRLVRVRRGRRVLRDVLAVVPGHRAVSLVRVARHFGGTSASFAPAEHVESLYGCPQGAMAPFVSSPGPALLVDPLLLTHREIYFNANRLDLSVALSTEDFTALARPQVASIAC